MHNKQRLELSFGLNAHEVGERLRNASDELGRNKRVLAYYLYDMNDRRLYQVSGHGSTVHFAESQLDMDQRRAREYVHVGRVLSELVLVDDAFCSGDISWSKVLAMLSIVQRETQEAWVDFAKNHTCRELKEELAGCEPGYLPGEGGGFGLICRKLIFAAKLPDEIHAMIEEARVRLSDTAKGLMSNEDLMAELLRFYLYRGDPPAIRQKEQVTAERNDEELDEEVRQQILRRDKHRCRNCDDHMDTEVHHIVFRSQGGSNIPDNLITLCMTCHAGVHRQFLKLEGNPERGKLTFFGSNGNPVNRSPSLLRST